MNNLSRLSLSCSLLLLLGACAAPSRIAPSTPTEYPEVGRVAPLAAVPDVTAAPRAQSSTPEPDERIGYGGIGFTSSPSTFLLSGGVDFPISDKWYWGPQLEWGLDNDNTLLAPQVNIKRFFDVFDLGSGNLNFEPFAQAGAGIAYLEKDQHPGDNDDVGFLLNVGGGVRLKLSEKFGVGSSLLLNYLPADVVDENFYFSWDVIQGVIYF